MGVLALPLFVALSLSALPDAPRSPPLLTAEGTRWGEDGKPVVGHPLIGVAVEAGVPDGVSAGLLVMPVSFLRLHLAGLTNGLGSGVRFGASLMPFPRWVLRPTVGADVGYTYGGQGAWLLGYVADETLRTALSNVTVAFATARAGIELGSRHVAFTLQGGISWINIDLGAQALQLDHGLSLKADGSALRGFIPSLRVGLLFCFG